jgi:NitT/TauT family transport system substrate-binding protein
MEAAVSFEFRTRAAALRALAVVASVASGRAAFAQSPKLPLTITVSPATDVLPYFYAQKQGMFEKAGLDVTEIAGTSGSANLVAVAGGSAQIGFANCVSIAVAFAKGVPVVMVACGGGYDAALPWAQTFVLSDSPIRSAKDLEGKTIGVTGLHDLFSMALKYWMEKQGADPGELHVVELPASSMIAALQSKRIDAFTIQEPFRGAAQAAGFRVLAAPYDAVARQFLTAAWFANATWAAHNRETALRFARVIHDAAAYTNEHFAQLLPLISSYSKIPLESLQQSRPIKVPLSLRPGIIQPLLDVANHFRELPAPVRAQDLVLPGVP